MNNHIDQVGTVPFVGGGETKDVNVHQKTFARFAFLMLVFLDSHFFSKYLTHC